MSVSVTRKVKHAEQTELHLKSMKFRIGEYGERHIKLVLETRWDRTGTQQDHIPDSPFHEDDDDVTIHESPIRDHG